MSSLNHVLKFGTTALAALVLSACGSSGGGDSNNNEATPTNNQVQQNQSNAPVNNNVVKPIQQVSSNETGATLVISGDDRNISVRRSPINGYNTTNINVDGTNVTIGFPGISAGN